MGKCPALELYNKRVLFPAGKHKGKEGTVLTGRESGRLGSRYTIQLDEPQGTKDYKPQHWIRAILTPASRAALDNERTSRSVTAESVRAVQRTEQSRRRETWLEAVGSSVRLRHDTRVACGKSGQYTIVEAGEEGILQQSTTVKYAAFGTSMESFVVCMEDDVNVPLPSGCWTDLDSHVEIVQEEAGVEDSSLQGTKSRQSKRAPPAANPKARSKRRKA